MGVFKDTQGRTWEVKVNIASVKRVREHLDADILNFESAIQRILSDPVFLVDVLYVVCKPQADSLGVSDVSFGEAFGGDVLACAKKALIEGIRDFFPTPEEREALEVAIQDGMALETAWRRRIINTIKSRDIEKIADQIWNETISGKLSTNLQASSESTPQT